MKKVVTLCAAILLATSFGASAFTLSGTPVVFQEEAFKKCATSKNFWVCIENYKRYYKK